MGWFDDMVGKARRRAQQEAARYAARKAQETARRTVEGLAGELLDRAEKELESAKKRREELFQHGEEEPVPPAPPTEEEAREARRKARAEREEQARQELERLKREAWAKSRKREPEE